MVKAGEKRKIRKKIEERAKQEKIKKTRPG